MALLNKTGISDGGTIQANHITRIINALTGESTDTVIASGSFTGTVVASNNSVFAGRTSFTATTASNDASSGKRYLWSYVFPSPTGSNTLPGEFGIYSPLYTDTVTVVAKVSSVYASGSNNGFEDGTLRSMNPFHSITEYIGVASTNYALFSPVGVTITQTSSSVRNYTPTVAPCGLESALIDGNLAVRFFVETPTGYTSGSVLVSADYATATIQSDFNDFYVLPFE
jgi:hypothetical protein